MGLKIEIGSGEYPKPGYAHVDIRPDMPCQEYRADICDLPFADNSVDEIVGIAIIEHLEAEQVPVAMAECYRALRLGGVLKLYTFNLLDLCRQILSGNSEHDLVTLIGWLYGRPLYPENYHRTAFTPDLLRRVYEDAKFNVSVVSVESGLYVEGKK